MYNWLQSLLDFFLNSILTLEKKGYPTDVELRLKAIIELLADFANRAVFYLLPFTWQRMALGPETGSGKSDCRIGQQNTINETILPIWTNAQVLMDQATDMHKDKFNCSHGVTGKHSA